LRSDGEGAIERKWEKHDTISIRDFYRQNAKRYYTESFVAKCQNIQQPSKLSVENAHSTTTPVHVQGSWSSWRFPDAEPKPRSGPRASRRPLRGNLTTLFGMSRLITARWNDAPWHIPRKHRRSLSFFFGVFRKRALRCYLPTFICLPPRVASSMRSRFFG
jgi:hypothetical protein